ncbi:MAG: arabinose ABC transporter substrate-binding protein [Acetivibrionales bacterium]|jgi:L-arabinose transport system substrate-binding protein
MKKAFVLVLAFTILLAIFAACGTKEAQAPAEQKQQADTGERNDDSVQKPKEAKKDIILAGIYKALDQVWFIDEGNAARETAIAMGASDVLLIDAKMNPDTYLSALDNVITQGVSGLLVCVPDQKLSKVTVEKCNAAGIPVIACDDALQDENGNFIAPFVGIDAKQIGRDMSKWTVEYVKANNKLADPSTTGLLLLTMDTVSSCVPRTEGQLEVWNEELPDFPKENIFKSDYNGETEKGFNAAAGTITANPQIKTWIVMTPNDEGAAGATRALEQANLDKDSIVVGLGGYLAKGEFEKDYSCFIASALIDAVDIGSTSAREMMEYLLEGKEIPPDYRISAKMVTKDNYKEIMGITE